ncbi:M56 family metallopeptidase, partial [Mitsuaria sp. GD03876]|uniref:M56 family metallopeptidase n=1 Tax=Mitsuaria sp. GD03876 TaxID=2975399 RepID=UPI00244A8ACA
MIDTLLHALPQALAQALLRQSVLLAIAALALLALRRPLSRHFGPGFAYAAWALIPLLLVVGALPASAPATRFSAELVRQIAPAMGQAEESSLTRVVPSSGTLWLMLWAIGVLVACARMVWLQRRFGASLTRAAGDPHWIGARGPALVGLWPPRLVLPPDFEQRFDARQRPLVLAHEAVHRRRCDNHWNALAAALCALHWFNPLAWLALRAMRIDQELSCDHAVMRAHPGREADYGRALLRAQQSPSSLQPWSGWGSSHPLIERVAMLAVRPRSPARRLFGAGALVLLGLGAAGVVQAVNAVAPAPNGELIGLEMAIQFNHRVDGVIRDQRLVPRLRLAAADGEKALVIMKSDQQPSAGGEPSEAEQLRIEVRPRRVDATHVLVAYDIREGGKPLLKSAVLVEDGIDAGMHTSAADDKDTEVVVRVRTFPASE